MPNTKSAERRMRSTARRRLHNKAIKSHLHSLERKYITLISAGKKADAATALKEVISAFDKAAKTGIVHKATADRKKSRLTTRLNKVP
ncbi:MAG TPA: 30S ribosomal protein S20 [Verrucomicrobiae bacterium]|nr:30S ribosomal protein S20 [Verrucomicrobiae bacterium]